MAETVTVMVLKLDLQCTSCYKKIKKILCKFPQIRGQIYDVKQNTVTISVACCSPEKFRDKLCCKGRKVIQSIEIKPPPKPKDPEKKTPNTGKTPEVVVENPQKGKKPADQPPPPRTCCGPCSEGYGGGPCYQGYPVPPPCYAGYYGYGYGCGCGCGCGRDCHLRRSVYYVEENPSACKIM